VGQGVAPMSALDRYAKQPETVWTIEEGGR
jgi:hypothetical protein